MRIENLNIIRRLWNQRSGIAQRRLALKKEIKEENMETHRVMVTVTDPNHTMQTQRKTKIMKRVKVQARDRNHAIDSAINHYRKAGYKVHDHEYIERVHEQLEEGRAAKYYEIAQSHKEKADAAKDDSTRNTHMADYHDSMSKHHDEMGRSNLAQSHADKAEKYHEKSMAKEEVAANNVGSGGIAGTQGDAGKKTVMTKEPLKRKKLTDFKEYAENKNAGEDFNIIEDFVEQLAANNNVDAEQIWEDLEDISDDELFEYAIDAKGHKSSEGGLTQKGVDYYNRKTGGNLKTAVTTPPSKLKPGSKAAKRRKSFCARMGGMKKRLTSAKTANDPDSRINKALRKWNC